MRKNKSPKNSKLIRKKSNLLNNDQRIKPVKITPNKTLRISEEELFLSSELSQLATQPAINNHSNFYKIPLLKTKFFLSVAASLCWFLFCFYLSIPWIRDLAYYTTLIPSIIIIFSIALIPGFMYMFLIIIYLLDKRTPFKPLKAYPFVSILIATYNEELSIAKTLIAIKNQDYQGQIEVIVIDDGSTDQTIRLAHSVTLEHLTVINALHGGKASALNIGLAQANAPYIITIDADTCLDKTALTELMNRLLSAPKGTVACAGAIYLENTQESPMTKIQFWDYFLAISVIKRTQSFLQGTLVAQGAFSVYEKKVLEEVGGWPTMVGEDIVLTWSLLHKGYYVDFAENAFAFTNAPLTYKQFFLQRCRWARGLIEAFRRYYSLLFKPRLSTFFIYWNLGFILFDTIFFFVFIPGVFAALLGYYFIAGPMTLAVLPLGFLSNLVFYKGQMKLFKSAGYSIIFNRASFFLYVLFYQFLMNPSVIYGYFLEMVRYKKTWGTK